MTFITKTLEVGRRAANILEIDLDRCARSYGVAPCTASLALTNNILESQTLDDLSEWVFAAGGVTPNDALAPDGTMTADKLEITGVGSIEKFFRQDTSSGPAIPTFTRTYTYSEFFNAAEIQYIDLNYWESGIETCFASFDVANGVFVNGGNLTNNYFVGAKIEPAINVDPRFTEPGWFRLSMTFTPGLPIPGSQAIGCRLQNSSFPANGEWVGVIGDGLHAWGAQIREGLEAGKYQPTTAAVVNGMGTVDDLCFNTFDTCQDTPNYLNDPQTYRFIDRIDRPVAISDAYPSIKNISYGATRLEPGGGLAIRGKVTVTLQDFTTNDFDIDDYTRERTYDPLARGTFFGKLKRRNRFYIGRPMRVLEGYVDEPFTFSNFRTREFIIESISGPDKSGKVVIVGKDPLSLARNDRAKCPVASTGAVAVAVTIGAGTVTVGAGEGVQYDPATVDTHIRIDDEIMLVVSRLVDVLTVTRGQGGTAAAAHSIGAAVQACKTYDDEPVIDIIQELLEDFANVPSSFIPFADWQTEETASLAGYDLTTIISEPTGVQKLLKEIVEITLLDVWYSDVDQEIKLKLQTPFTEVTQMLTDADNVLENSLLVKDDNQRRLTRVLIYYGIRNFARDLTETENYSLVNFEIEADKEGVNKFNDEKIKVMFSRWMDSSNAVQIQLTSQRLLDRFGNMPVEISFDLDAKDVAMLKTGDVYDLQTRVLPGVTGLPETVRFQVIETKPIKPASIYRYKSLAFFADPSPDSIVISANETDYDLFVELGGPPGPVDVIVTVNAGVFIRGTVGNPAFKTDGMHPDSTIVLINNGHIHGHGGRGGGGGFVSIESFFEAEGGGFCFYGGVANIGAAGEAGGDALQITVSDIEIDNTNGDIFGGGGGGGGGNSVRSFGTGNGGGGGGGGLGEDTPNGGVGGIVTITSEAPQCPLTTTNGTPGTGGTDVAGGVNGVGTGSAGDGGVGATDWGLSGELAPLNSAGGGPGGFAVRLNGASIMWTGGNIPAQVKGGVG